jgi:hypothetical protein
MQRGQVILMDTSVIIEAYRTNCWKAVTAHFSVATVEKCYEETLTGDPLRPGYVAVDPDDLRRGLVGRDSVSNAQRAALLLSLENADALDAGERDLLACLLGRPGVWLVSCADRAAVNAALAMGFEDRLVSLDAIAKAAGARPDLRRHFTEAWLREVRTAFKLDRL